MIIKSLRTSGILDLSSQQTHRDKEFSGDDHLHFRLVLRPGQTVEVDDRYRRLKNINSAINAGWLQVISYAQSPTSTFVHKDDGSAESGGAGQGTVSGGINLDLGETGTVDEVSLLDCRTIKWFISVADETYGTYLSTEIFANHNGITACWNEHSEIGDANVSFDVDVDSGKIRLRATATANGQKIKSERLCVSI